MSFATYSIFPGTSQESNSFNNINDVLNVLPDNTSKFISPKDVRDAVFSNWENSVIRYTSNSSGTQYIGVAREDVKDKLFLGKKNLGTNNILSNSVLSANSDVDIFFYNTKSDSGSQDLKIGFLAGSSQSLHNSIPYLEVVQVSGGTPSLGLNLSHNQPFGGDFNFQAGSNGRISLNSLILPSVNEFTTMISSPSASLVGDLFLVRSSSGFLELRTGGSVTSTLGSSGSPTNIYGSDVFVNGSSLEFTDLNPTLQDFGGFPQGSTFSSVPLVEMIRQLLYPYLPPQVSILFSSPVLERNHISDTVSNFSYTLVKRSNNIISTQIQIRSNSGPLSSYYGNTLSGSGYTSQNFNDVFTFSGVNVQSNTSGTFTFSITANDGTQSVTATSSLKFVYPYFFGFYPTTPTFSNNTVMNDVVSELNSNGGKLVKDYGSQSLDLTGTGYLCFCYPYDYGTLSTIYDGNGFKLWQVGSASNSWTYSSSAITIYSPDSLWSGVSYRVFATTTQVTIPLPSQSFQFNF